MKSVAIDTDNSNESGIVLHPTTPEKMGRKRQQSPASMARSYYNILINPITGRPTNLVYIVLGVILVWIIYATHYRSEPPASNPKLNKLGDEYDVPIDERRIGDEEMNDGKVKFNPDLVPFQHLLHPQQPRDGQAFVKAQLAKTRDEDEDVPKSRRGLPRAKPKDFPVDILQRPALDSAKCPISTYTLIVVASLPSEIKLRNAIRRSWGNPHNFGELKISGLTWKTVFAIGKGDEETNTKIAEESKTYGDVLQGRFDDIGVEDTRKAMMAFKWIADELVKHEGCRPAFVLKTPAHVYIHMPYVLDWIAHDVKHLQHVYRGKMLRGDDPIRNENDPLYIPPEDYAGDIFPNMIRNPVYLFSTDVVEGMAKRFDTITPIAMEDSYLGIIANEMGVKPVDDEHFLLMQKPRNICHYSKMMFVYNVSPSEQMHVFNVVERGHMAEMCEDHKGL
ncbi:beta-1,3-galactosyltransferase 1-like [Amphiura filiformis]|uniref:beta-1,3-galactosyltransferase 1-like n=1 Tax=Amphiura filiformis TaxID=82378 RepID=UPI003B21AA72